MKNRYYLTAFAAWLLAAGCGGKTNPGEKEVIVASEEEISDLDLEPLVIDCEGSPVIIKSVRPKYPEEAREAKIEGDVILLVYVDENGDVRKAVVKSSPGVAGMDEAAKEAALECKFKPATYQGKPVGIWYLIVMEFRLPSDE